MYNRAKAVLLVVIVLCVYDEALGKLHNMKMGRKYLEPDHPLYHRFASRRGAAQAAGDIYNFEMGGNIYPVGIYWTGVGLGTPQQNFQVAVDSGSSDLIIPSSTCQGCHVQNTGTYNYTESSSSIAITCKNITVKCNFLCTEQCTFRDTYQTCNLTDPQQTCTVSGYLYSDVFHEGVLSANVVFGAIEQQTSNFQQFFVIDGVLGMAFSTISSWGGEPPFDKLVQAGEIDNVFSMCMKGEDGGVLTLGGADSNLYSGEFQYTPLVATRGEYFYYVLDLNDVQISGTSIGVPPTTYTDNGFGGCVLDSGTNVILFPDNIYQSFQSTFQNLLCPNFPVPGVCGDAPNLFNQTCYAYTASQISQFPAIAFKVNDILLNITAEDYIVSNGSGLYCLGFLNTGVRGNLIVGDVLMQNYYVTFDKGNHQVGWATPNLDNCIGESGYGYY